MKKVLFNWPASSVHLKGQSTSVNINDEAFLSKLRLNCILPSAMRFENGLASGKLNFFVYELCYHVFADRAHLK